MASESDGMVTVTILASNPTIFSYNITVSAMDIEAMGNYCMYVYGISPSGRIHREGILRVGYHGQSQRCSIKDPCPVSLFRRCYK